MMPWTGITVDMTITPSSIGHGRKLFVKLISRASWRSFNSQHNHFTFHNHGLFAVFIWTPAMSKPFSILYFRVPYFTYTIFP
ncbi:hypothetical protein PanWU01x14_193910 [Parasponia andersonii]|uniref:Uncharacterized protein n=1 Tax=Parasponia andersonii TaxID=3476 RepID=A0A2P5C0S6_PARAD|nr:hypothetical protein PanWU01x14_193910 [Parasponia andersonii]